MLCVKDQRILLCAHKREVPSVTYLRLILTQVRVASVLKSKILHQRALLLLRAVSQVLRTCEVTNFLKKSLVVRQVKEAVHSKQAIHNIQKKSVWNVLMSLFLSDAQESETSSNPETQQTMQFIYPIYAT